ncbi:carbohydrate kinase family protein [Aureimonas frigidaquae]|uniref:hypothetical protein n=1 Tax=Aureimonas frigidaquae TaxID=424757 RepID=UPI00078504F6|nr:hypothetical protein [Aureimonas frigidaquae]
MLTFLGSVQRDGNAASTGWAADQARAAAVHGTRVQILSPDLPALGEGQAEPDPAEGVEYRHTAGDAAVDDAVSKASTTLVLIPDIDYALLMKAAGAARSSGQTVVLVLPDMPQWLDMPKLHALLGRTDILVLRQAELERAVDLLGRDMLGESSTTMEMVASLAYWASFGVIATDGREGAVYAEGENAPTRYLSPDGHSLADSRVFNMFAGALAASLPEHGLPDAIRYALDAVGQRLRADGTPSAPKAADIVLRS